MRKLTLLAVAALATAATSLVVSTPVHAGQSRPKAELVAAQVTATLIDGNVTAKATVKNKGTLKAPASTAGFYLSADATKDSDDISLGTAPVGKIKPEKSKVTSGLFTLPATVSAGTYRVIACADSASQVKEPKETNDCKAAAGSIAVTGTPTGAVTVSAAAGNGGDVATSAVTGATCVGTVCTFPTAGTGTVTFTPTPHASYRFSAWTGATCTGFTVGSGGRITFTNPTTAKTCTATFRF